MPDLIKNLNTENETISATLPQEGEDLLIQQSKNTKKVEDLEVKDAQLIFSDSLGMNWSRNWVLKT